MINEVVLPVYRVSQLRLSYRIYEKIKRQVMKTMKSVRFFILGFISLTLFACSGSSSDGTGGTGGAIDNNGATATDTVTVLSRVERAIATGDPSHLTDPEEMLDAAINKLNAIKEGNKAHLQEIYGDSPIAYDPGHSSQFIAKKDYDRFIPLLYGNKGNILAAAGIDNNTRYAAFGSNPVSFFTNGNNLEYEEPFKRLLAWLLSKNPETVSELNQPLNVGLSLFSSGEKSKVTNWIQGEIPEWQLNTCDEEDVLTECYKSQDLLILASNGTLDGDMVTEALEQAVEQEIPVLFLRQTTWGTYAMDNIVLSAINLNIGSYGGNWWADDQADWDSVEDMVTLDSGLNSVETMLQHFKADDYDFDWSYCTSYVGSVSCGDVPGLKDEFENGASSVRSLLGGLDKSGFRLFEKDGYGLVKHLVLLGDVYRNAIQYPMDKEATDSNTFFRSYYADYSVYYNRSINPKQADLGTFSDELPGDVPVVTRFVVFDAKPQGGFTATGLYALPGKTVTIRRIDTGTDTVKIFMNSMRTGSSRVYNANLYNRPKFLRSHSVSLPENGEINLTSPYGGPIFIEPSKNHVVELEISDAGEHAVLLDMSDVDSYAAELENSPYTWTQIKTPFVEIHSRTDKMLGSINSEPYNGDAGALIDDIWTYLIKDSYELAGFVGDGLTRSDSVMDFCSTMGWDCEDSDIHKAPKTQHINVDLYANCGGGCSGNPYDQTWAITPKGWGESHEIGHNLQRGRLKIYGGQSGEVSNQIFPLHKYYTYNRDYGYEFGAKSYYEQMFTTLQDAVNSDDPFTVAYDAVWAETGYAKQNRQRMTFYMQIVHQGETLAFLDNGWELLTLMYMQNRLFGSVSDWAGEKDGLGFSTYESKPDIDGNDFMLISMSWITGKDQRSFFDMWGVSYSDEAGNQVESYGFPSTGKYFYIPENAVDYKPLEFIVPVDGAQDWPIP